MEANEYPGPAVVNVYTTCQPEHGVPDCNSSRQAKMAVEARAFPLFTYDPRKGEKIRERLSLQGNPAQKDDWWTPPNSDKQLTFIDFARTEGRFAKQFDKDGNPSPQLLSAQEERLQNWHRLQELAGLR
jgi:pyruvate/2-oxoacid:ferredoxin oxidoreductase beta subunit